MSPCDGSRSGSGPGRRSRRPRRRRNCVSSGGGSRTPPSADSPQGTHAGPAPSRAGSATLPRAGMPVPCPGCGTPTPGCGDDAGHRPPSGVHPMPRIAHRVGSTRWAPPSGLDSVGSTQWPPPDGLHRVDSTPARRTTMDATVVRSAMVRHRTRCAAPPDDARHPRARRCAAPDAPHRTGAPAAGPTLVRVRPDRTRPLVRLRYTSLSSSATAMFLLDIAGFGWRSGRGQGGV
jgi:hypothetical protein